MLRESEERLASNRLWPFVESIAFRLLAPLCISVGLVLAVHAVLSFRSMQEYFLRFVRADAQRCSELIERATHDGMLLNRLDEVQSTFERLADGAEIAAIRCYDKQGMIVLSADRAEIGRNVKLDSDTCRSCHGPERIKAAAVLERSSLTHRPAGPDVLRHLSIIENEASCATAACHAHPADQKVLGVLDVEMSMAPLDLAVGTARLQLVRTTILLLLLIGVVAALFVQRVVRRPVRQFHEGTQRIARGDLETRIEIRGRHELAQLADAFNSMVDELSHARRSITEWSRTLEEKVAQKTEELRRAQHEVLHMEKMASLGKLSASVAHELNNPLAGMLTYARLIEREIDGQALAPEVREELGRYLDLIQQETRRCGEIVKNLLTFARPREMKRTTIDVSEIVDRCLMLVRHHLEMRGIQLDVQQHGDDHEILADGDQVQQALLALFVNAVDAMSQLPSGQGRLMVRLRPEPDEVQIEVGDCGVGIAPDVLPHIFEPFFSTKQTGSGVGLGLAVVYGIVHRHGGSIDVESEPGRGTTFRLHLPRRPPKIDDAALAVGGPLHVAGRATLHEHLPGV
ncbi:MAG: ATP-binding protein [Phycisphaerae bacterium]|nr:ATP-binding protein [Phycisphaerae bacterium]